MGDHRIKYVPPSIEHTAFNCPHCGALAKQIWYHGHADSLAKDRVPRLMTKRELELADFEKVKADDRDRAIRVGERLVTGLPFLEGNAAVYGAAQAHNVAFSRCFNCDEIAIWVYNQQVYPQAAEGALPNPDLPPEVMRDYREASGILNQSPRGAAALLRLCIQKICGEVGGTGKNINEDIKLLVSKGLDARVQQALDVVRVVGNNAVHPGQIDLSDDRATAEQLFNLVNLIADRMISQPKHVQSMFDGLPEEAKRQIAKRDEGESDSPEK
ncbi:MAG TPA: DUF4145 domain-containing protein [Sphingomicrobium sp.]|nr:DUF4145 domain-containing protein [Sphingomicrobium sp.]